MKKPAVLLGLAVLIALGGGVTALEAKPKPPSAAKRFREALKNFSRAKSYDVSAKIQGGISNAPDHSLKQVTVREQYSGAVNGKLMHVPAGANYPRAFRISGKAGRGAVSTGIGWRQILADRKGARLDRLFSFPEKLLGRAAKYSKKARWLPTPKSDVSESDVSDETGEIRLDDDAKDDTAKDGDAKKGDDKKSGKTFVKEKGDKEEGFDPNDYRLLRVEAPPREALKHFIEVENSGCMSAG